MCGVTPPHVPICCFYVVYVWGYTSTCTYMLPLCYLCLGLHLHMYLYVTFMLFMFGVTPPHVPICYLYVIYVWGYTSTCTYMLPLCCLCLGLPLHMSLYVTFMLFMFGVTPPHVPICYLYVVYVWGYPSTCPYMLPL